MIDEPSSEIEFARRCAVLRALIAARCDPSFVARWDTALGRQSPLVRERIERAWRWITQGYVPEGYESVAMRDLVNDVCDRAYLDELIAARAAHQRAQEER